MKALLNSTWGIGLQKLLPAASRRAAESVPEAGQEHVRTGLAYRREIDGLRAVAILPVILYHAGYHLFRGGFVGVDVFFVISGYLITSIILAELEAGTFSLAKFYERRARRILPALFLVMAVCIPAAWMWLLQDDMEDFLQSIVAVPLFSSNFLFWSESGYFDTAAELKPLLHTWSLAVEEQYYVLFPLFMLLMWRAAWLLVAFVAVVSLALAQWGVYTNPTATFFLLPTRAWELAIGASVALYLARKPASQPGGLGQQALAGMGLMLIGYAVVVFHKELPFPSLYALVPTIGAALIILYATSTTLVGRLLGQGPIVGIGLISYSAYLWHQPLFVFARHRAIDAPSRQEMLGLAAVALLLAYGSWRFVETPFRKSGRISRRGVLAFSLLGSFAFIGFGIAGQMTEGFQSRLEANAVRISQELARLDQERHIATEADTCHFNNRTGIGLDGFLQQWACTGEQEPGLQRVPIAIAGDSNSADIAMALRQNGYSPLQLGGAGCSLVPSLMDPECKLIFEKLRSVLAGTPYYSHLILANNFSEKELDEASVREMISYWQGYGVKLILFVGAPQFGNFEKLLTRGHEPVLAPWISRHSKREPLLELYRVNDIYLIDRDHYYCFGDTCDYKTGDDAFLFTDGEHLTVLGATLVGRRLISEEPLLSRLVKQDQWANEKW